VETPRKRKNLLRAALAAKGLGRGAELFALPDAPGAYVGTVLTATPDHEGRRPTPLSCSDSTTDWLASSIAS